MKTDLFQSCGHCSVFQICWHIACSTLTASSFRTWTSSAGILLADDFIRFHNIDQTAVEWHCDIVLHFCSLRSMSFQISQILKCVWVYLLSKVILYNLSYNLYVILYNLYLEKEMATHSSILAWKIPWMEEPGRLQSMGSQRVGHDWVTSLSLSYNLYNSYLI